MSMTEIATLIEKIGFGLVCGAAVIYIFIDMYNRNKASHTKKEDQQLQQTNEQNKQYQDMYSEMFDMLKKQNTMMTEKIINEITRHTITPEENVALSLIEDQINSCLKRVLEKCNASRVGLVRFHNGGRDMNRLSFLKMSVTNEIIKPGLKPLQPEFQNMFRSFFHWWCSELNDSGHCFIKDIEEIREKDPSMYEFLKSRGINSEFGIPIQSESGCIVGYIFIEYIDKDDVKFEQVQHCLADKKIKIETLMNLNGKEE